MIVFISFFILVCYIRLLRYLNFYDPSCTIYLIYSNDSDVSLLLVLNIYCLKLLSELVNIFLELEVV